VGVEIGLVESCHRRRAHNERGASEGRRDVPVRARVVAAIVCDLCGSCGFESDCGGGLVTLADS
jgi:hypothetical protein